MEFYLSIPLAITVLALVFVPILVGLSSGPSATPSLVGTDSSRGSGASTGGHWSELLWCLQCSGWSTVAGSCSWGR